MGSPDDYRAWYELIMGGSPSRETLFYISLLIAILFIEYFLIRKDVKGYRTKKNKVRSILSDYGSEYTGRRSQRIYIPARFQSIAPEFNVDLSDSVRTVASQNLMDFYLKQVLVKNNVDKHCYLILGGSGMGKSSFVVQLVKKYYRLYLWGKEPYNITLIPCGSKNVIERIKQTNNKESSVLILDALDECNEAIDNYDNFIKELEASFEEFHLVIITCRTQFFEGDDEIRRDSSVPAQSREKGYLRYEIQYISPFTDQEIDKFLRKKFYLHWKKRKRAKSIVERNNLIMVRPLLLSYIDDLVQSQKTLNNKAEVYRTLIERWINREANFEPDPRKRGIIHDNLYKMSREIAVHIYNNWVDNRGLFMPYNDYNALEQQFKVSPGVNFHYRGRSLINWDAEKNRKFAHKSFLEYFLAIKLIEDNSFSVNTSGLDEVRVFYSDMCQSILEREIEEHRIIYVAAKPPTGFDYMCFKEAPKCEYRFLTQHPDMLVIDWNMISQEMLDWLKSRRISLLIIKNLTRGEFTNELTGISGLRAIYFYQSIIPPSQRLQKSFTSKRINYAIISSRWRDDQYVRVFQSFLFKQRQADWFSSNEFFNGPFNTQ